MEREPYSGSGLPNVRCPLGGLCVGMRAGAEITCPGPKMVEKVSRGMGQSALGAGDYESGTAEYVCQRSDRLAAEAAENQKAPGLSGRFRT